MIDDVKCDDLPIQVQGVIAFPWNSPRRALDSRRLSVLMPHAICHLTSYPPLLFLAAKIEMDVDLENVPSQIGTATLDMTGKILKTTGEFDREEGRSECAKLYRILMDSSKCVGDEQLKRISVSFDSHKFILTTAKNHIYIVKIESNDM